MEFKRFCKNDFQAVCGFLTALNTEDRTHINWNWARFEWMYGHPEFDQSALDAIGLWTDSGKVVGAAIYDMYFGEAFCAVLPGYEDLYPEVLQHAWNDLKDENGLGIAVCDGSNDEKAALLQSGFLPAEQTETVMSLDLDHGFEAALSTGYTIREIDPYEETDAVLWLFWQGFDHGDDRAEFEKEEQPECFGRPHFRKELSLTAVDEQGVPAAYASLWFMEGTDYAYVEPVCTVPQHRGKGLAKALLYEAFSRAAKLGAKKAYVISDMEFYEKLGFRKTFRYTFFWKK